MLVRIEKLQGIGVFHDTAPAQHKFETTTLLYGQNGRGKSTLACILRSVASGVASVVEEKRTLGGDQQPCAIIQFDDGQKAIYSAAGWSQTRPEVVVFDATFIDENVYSGSAIEAGHRKGLLEFALGKDAVNAKLAADSSAAEAKAAASRVGAAKKGLAGYHVGMSLEAFIALPEIDELENKLAAQKRLLSEARRAESLRKRSRPEQLPVPAIDFKPLIDVLGLSLAGVHDAAAAALVELHVKELGTHDAEAWLSIGAAFLAGDSCPYCGQDISSNSLIKAYRSLFNAEFLELQNSVQGLAGLVDGLLEESTADSIVRDLEQQAQTELLWSEELDFVATTTDGVALRDLFTQLRSLLSPIVELKVGDPTAAIGVAVLDDANEAAQAIRSQVEAANVSLATSRSAVDVFISDLDLIEESDITALITTLKATRTRYSADVVSALAELTDEEEAKKLAEKEKVSSRRTLERLMAGTLTEYEGRINEWLKIFGVPFSIRDMGHNFSGGGPPKTEYFLEIRSARVPLSGGPPSFATTLSDGEKRTLALAFFLAQVFANPELANSTIVLDDPMSSFDDDRQTATIDSIRRLSQEAGQVIVLAHNHRFLWDVERACASGSNPTLTTSLQISRVAGDYSGLKALDLERECESRYLTEHRTIRKFVSTGEGDLLAVAKALRPVVEGYLHRRFPGDIRAGQMLGQTIEAIATAEEGDVLSCASNQVQELRNVNRYASKFHHQTNPDCDAIEISENELRTFCQRALSLVHGWT